jgi:hypothetical protein
VFLRLFSVTARPSPNPLPEGEGISLSRVLRHGFNAGSGDLRAIGIARRLPSLLFVHCVISLGHQLFNRITFIFEVGHPKHSPKDHKAACAWRDRKLVRTAYREMNRANQIVSAAINSLALVTTVGRPLDRAWQSVKDCKGHIESARGALLHS